MLARDRRHGRLQHTVNAVLDHQRVVIGFQVNIRSAALEGGKDGGIHQPDNRADVLFRRELLDRDILIGIVFGGNDVEREALGRLVEHSLRLLRLF